MLTIVSALSVFGRELFQLNALTVPLACYKEVTAK